MTVRTLERLQARFSNARHGNEARDNRDELESVWTPGYVQGLDHRLPYETAHVDDKFWSNGAAATPTGGTILTIAGTASWLEGDGLLSGEVIGVTSSDVSAIIYPLTPTSAPITIETRVKLNATQASGNGSWAGLGFCDGSIATSTHASCAMSWVSSILNGQLRQVAGTFTNFGGITNTTPGALNGTLGQYLYYRCVWTGGTSFANRWSFDRLNWLGSGTFAVTLTPTDLCVWTTDNNSNTLTTVTFEYIRVYEADLS